MLGLLFRRGISLVGRLFGLAHLLVLGLARGWSKPLFGIVEKLKAVNDLC